MRFCCPPGHGCNAPGGAEPCFLALCRSAGEEEPTAARAVARWAEWTQAYARSSTKHERRFKRRAYERAREHALRALLVRAHMPAGAGAWPQPAPSGRRAALGRGRVARSYARLRRAGWPPATASAPTTSQPALERAAARRPARSLRG